MERYRDYQIGSLMSQKSGEPFQGKQCQRGAEMGTAIVFERVDQFTNRSLIAEVGMGKVKMGGMNHTVTTTVVAPHTDERDAADRAERRRYRRDLFPALGTNMEFSPVRDERMADVTDGGEQQVEQRPKKLLDGCHGVYFTNLMALIITGDSGTSGKPRVTVFVAAILSTTSIPVSTLPNTA